MPTPIYRDNAATYQWANGCHSWILQDNKEAIVKEESMSPGSSETLHHHRQMTQFFYILAGNAQFLIQEDIVEMSTGQGITIEAGTPHLIQNPATTELRFLVISAPGIVDDRENLNTD